MKKARQIYFIGIGGIGMSALARFYKAQGASVSGYDRTPSPLTRRLEAEGIEIRYVEDVESLPKDADLVVHTAAIGDWHSELKYYIDHDYRVKKRAEVLGAITRTRTTVGVAGSHGKTSVSSMLAHLLTESHVGCTAFLGGIAANYGTNFWTTDSDVAVVEADEFDRSFLHLHPDVAIVTATDADHLDIYGTVEAMREAFVEYVGRVHEAGTAIIRHGLPILEDINHCKVLTYAADDPAADYHATCLNAEPELVGGAMTYAFDVASPVEHLTDLRLHMFGHHNVENAIAAIAAAQTLGATVDEIRAALATFRGIERRSEVIFEGMFNGGRVVYIDDYAHHPREISATLDSARRLFPNRKITAVFQPHLFTRTQDLAAEFGESLSAADEVILLNIYPAREAPIEGVTSALLQPSITCASTICAHDALVDLLAERKPEVLLTMGAGDVSTLVPAIKAMLEG